jgi:hypothetical protein
VVEISRVNDDQAHVLVPARALGYKLTRAVLGARIDDDQLVGKIDFLGEEEGERPPKMVRLILCQHDYAEIDVA